MSTAHALEVGISVECVIAPSRHGAAARAQPAFWACVKLAIHGEEGGHVQFYFAFGGPECRARQLSIVLRQQAILAIWPHQSDGLVHHFARLQDR
jgi:hypothetical protein